MKLASPSPVWIALTLALPTACGDDSGTGGDAGSSGGSTAADTTSSNPSTTTTNPSGTGISGSADGSSSGPGSSGGDSTSSATTDATTTGMDSSSGGGGSSSGGMASCQVWEITYELEGSTFEISDTPFGAGDQVNELQMPYDADTTVGPGEFVLRFQDMGGQPGGMAAMVSYTMSMHFVVDSGFTVVETDLEADAGPDVCGITTGMLAGDTVAWMPSAIVGHHSMGQILCNGGLCGVGGLPDGMPVPIDEVTDQPIDDFVFSGDLSSFTMAQTVIAMDANSTTAWMYAGAETGRQLVDSPACLCP